MRTVLARTFSRLAHWLHPKAVPQALTGTQWSGTGFVDAYKRDRNPTWTEYDCNENNNHVAIGKQTYFLSADGYLMPSRKGQRPPDTRYFEAAK